jgi:immune inhibitor A
VTVTDVKTSRQVYRLWKDGASGSEYFLLENRQRTGYDAQLPGDGLLLWHIDDSKPTNTDENHYKVGLVQADGDRDLELAANRGDGGDPYPGSASATSVTGSTKPNTKSYVGQDTFVALTGIPASSASMTIGVRVKAPLKRKELVKDNLKEAVKEVEVKHVKEGKEFKEAAKEGKELERPFEPPDYRFNPAGSATGAPSGNALTDALSVLDQAVGLLHGVVEAQSAATTGPFIGASLRPDLQGGPVYADQAADLNKRMAEGDPSAKRAFDTTPSA